MYKLNKSIVNFIRVAKQCKYNIVINGSQHSFRSFRDDQKKIIGISLPGDRSGAAILWPNPGNTIPSESYEFLKNQKSTSNVAQFLTQSMFGQIQPDDKINPPSSEYPSYCRNVNYEILEDGSIIEKEIEES